MWKGVIVSFLLLSTVAQAKNSKDQNESKEEAISPEIKKIINGQMPNTTRNEKLDAVKIYNLTANIISRISDKVCVNGEIQDQQLNKMMLDYVIVSNKMDIAARDNISTSLKTASLGLEDLRSLAEKIGYSGLEITKVVYTSRMIIAGNAADNGCYNLASDQYIKIMSYKNILKNIDIDRLVSSKLEEIKYKRKISP